MKNLAMKQLDEKDKEFAKALINLGIDRNIARMLAYLRNMNEAKSVDVEKGAGLHQPEVSIAVKKLKKFNWITIREKKKPGKGRQHKVYSLKVSVDRIISDLEKQHDRDAEKTLARIKRLKELK